MHSLLSLFVAKYLASPQLFHSKGERGELEGTAETETTQKLIAENGVKLSTA